MTKHEDFSVVASSELRELRQKAARYDWLRQQQWNGAPLCVVAHPRQAVKLGYDCPAMERLDEAIDEEMAKESTHA